MKRDARVFVRCGDSPWISTYCPNCGKRISADDHFCKECGQELSFENFNKVLELNRLSKIKLTRNWTEYEVNEEDNQSVFLARLEQLEKEFLINTKENPIVKILRNEYIKTAFENKQKVKK